MDKKTVAELFFNLKRKIEPLLTEEIRNDDEFIELWDDLNQELDLDQFQKQKKSIKTMIDIPDDSDDEDSVENYYDDEDEDDPEELEF